MDQKTQRCLSNQTYSKNTLAEKRGCAYCVWLVMAFVLVLSGCVKSQLVREVTADFASEAGVTILVVDKQYADLIKDEREFWRFLNSVDYNCINPNIRQNWIKQVPTTTSICSPPEPKPTSAPSVDLETIQLMSERSQARLLVVYIASLAKAVTIKPVKNDALFTARTDDFNTLSALLEGDLLLNDSKVEASAGLIAFISELSKNREAAINIRAIVNKNREAVSKAFMRLEDSQKKINALLKLELNLRFAALDEFAVPILRSSRIDSAERIAYHDAYFEAKDAYESLDRSEQRCLKRIISTTEVDQKVAKDACENPTGQVLKLAISAHRNLLDLLDGKLTNEQKARSANLIFKNFIRSVKLITSFRSSY